MALGQAPFRHPNGPTLKKRAKNLMEPLAYKKNEMVLFSSLVGSFPIRYSFHMGNVEKSRQPSLKLRLTSQRFHAC